MKIAEVIDQIGYLNSYINQLDFKINDLLTGINKNKNCKRIQVNICGSWIYVPAVTAHNLLRELEEARECFKTELTKYNEVAAMADALAKGALSE